MLRVGPYAFKIAETSDELEQVHRLNYRTFVREIAQHQDTGSDRLVDKFHDKNVYMIGLKDNRLVGMLAAHDRPPFSVAARLPDPSILDRPGLRPLEVRLLTVEPEERNSPVMLGVVWFLQYYARSKGYTHFLISGVMEQQSLYRHIGFEPLGPPAGVGRASFVPMWATIDRVQEKLGRTIALWAKRLEPLGNEAAATDDKETRK